MARKNVYDADLLFADCRCWNTLPSLTELLENLWGKKQQNFNKVKIKNSKYLKENFKMLFGKSAFL